ncbi:n-glycosylase/DNA lyase-like protein [Neoconidiobolus thromboides FSU 785]|nr:n-glycosylase/DNA lyase-like protein [Neoconidiobolus thromboides FSU 785]
MIKNKILVPFSELCLSTVLKNGQSFTWEKTGDKEWTSVLNGLLLSLTQLDDGIEYRIHSNLKQLNEENVKKTIVDYFQLEKIDLSLLYKSWSNKDTNFAKKGLRFPGVRVLRQDPVENLFSFICSSNNNITRITKMVQNLCEHYGELVGEYQDKKYYNFPKIECLTEDQVEAKLRALGFGYRAKYINKSAKKLAKLGGEEWLLNLREVPYEKCKHELLMLEGVGPKVADCVCLMSLDKHDAIPVDTHVFQIAKRDYGFKGGRNKTLSRKEYDSINQHFRDIFGEYAGWAHSILFTADLKMYEEVN